MFLSIKPTESNGPLTSELTERFRNLSLDNKTPPPPSAPPLKAKMLELYNFPTVPLLPTSQQVFERRRKQYRSLRESRRHERRVLLDSLPKAPPGRRLEGLEEKFPILKSMREEREKKEHKRKKKSAHLPSSRPFS